jgi:putative lipoic acid-binding regulatory protein
MSEQGIDQRESSLETLRETHAFPCEFQFKVIGANSSSFVARVVQAGINAVGPTATPRISTKESSKGSYISVSMEMTMKDAETILDVYDGVRNLEQVKFVL